MVAISHLGNSCFVQVPSTEDTIKHENIFSMLVYSHILSSLFRYTAIMEKYPLLNQAVGNVLLRQRQAMGMSKRKLSEEALIDRAYITGLESGRWNVSLNALFFLSEAMGIDPVDFVAQVKSEREVLAKAQNV